MLVICSSLSISVFDHRLAEARRENKLQNTQTYTQLLLVERGERKNVMDEMTSQSKSGSIPLSTPWQGKGGS